MSAIAEQIIRCDLPPAAAPPEARGLSRGAVRLLVSTTERDIVTDFSAFGSYFHDGDVLVLNTSGTRRAAIDLDALPLTLHVSSRTDRDEWIVEFRTRGGHAPHRGPVPSTAAIGELRMNVLEPFNDDQPTRLWLARFDGDIEALLSRRGRFIEYDYVVPTATASWRQNVYATTPGSAELASAGRPITRSALHELEARGVRVVPLVLHSGVSSQEAGELPHPEFYDVPAATHRAVVDARESGSRVIAVGTTVVRALETVARTSKLRGFTDLVLEPGDRPLLVDGLLSGFHPPDASHLELLAAVTNHDIVRRAYDVACRGGFTSHEFGDSHLLFR